MADIQEIFQINSRPGIKRDGTDLDSDYYADGQWCRFQRGRPKKIGGYKLISDQITGPIRDIYVDSRLGVNSIHTFSPWGVQRLNVDATGTGGAVTDRTPAGFAMNANYTWQSSAMYSSTGGAYTALIASSTPDLADIASDSTGGIYAGDITGTAAMTQVADGSGNIVVSGGCVVVGPFLFVYGSNGLIRNSNTNDFSTGSGWTTGGANFSNSANIGGTKIVKGFAQRGGSGAPASLFWSLDSLIRVTLGNSDILWRYDTVTGSITVLSKAGIIEYDGLYFWVGVDRFFVYNGVVQELPNQMNCNWFFDNLNYAQRQKVWAMKVPRFGEIWWFYPRGSATECTDCIIYNVREQTWYDNHIGRSAGFESQVFHYPVMAGIEDARNTIYLAYTGGVGTLRVGDTVIGGTSGAGGTIVRSLSGSINVNNVTGITPFINGETITSSNGATAVLSDSAQTQTLDTIWQHETGVDKVSGQEILAIESNFKTTNFSFKTGGPSQNITPTNVQSYIDRIEPDFVQTGAMNVYVEGGSYANSSNIESIPYEFTSSTEHIDPREQRGIISLKFVSNVAGGNYEMGKVLGTITAGDERG